MNKKLFAQIWLTMIGLGITYIMFDAIKRDPTILYCLFGILFILILVGVTVWAATILTVDKND